MERAARNAAWTENGGELIRLADFIEANKGSKASLKEDSKSDPRDGEKA